MTEKLLTVSSSPHVRGKQSTAGIMRDVLIALAPAGIMGIVRYGVKAVILMIVGVAFAVAAEYATEKIMKRPITIGDMSAAVTGLLLAYNMPVNAPWWMLALGSIFAIVLVKQIFGGIGCNFVNPALAARAFLVASWPTLMTGGAFLTADAVATATPLAIVKNGLTETLPSVMSLFTGVGIDGCIGELSALALLIGGAYLIYRNVMSWRIPVFYIGSFALMCLLTGKDVAFNVFAGGLFLGAIFMATDYVTSPNTPVGEIIYAIGCGLITYIIRFKGGYPEGVSYSILLMNLVTPLLDKYIKVKKFGEVAKKKNA